MVKAFVSSVECRLVLTSDHSVKPSRLHTHPNCPSLFIWPPRHPQQPLDLDSTESDLVPPTCLTRLTETLTWLLGSQVHLEGQD